MKIYISTDMEGMPGTFNWDQEKTDRASVRRNYTRHVQTVLENIIAHPRSAEIDEILIADSHSAGDNLDYSITALDRRIDLISGCPRQFYMMPDLSPEFDQVFLLGYHSGTGALRGNMDHTYSNSRIHKIFINGKPMNEALINSAYAGWMGVPVSLVSGDITLQSELASPMPWLNYVPTKKAVAKFAARNFSQSRVDETIKLAVERALNLKKTDIPLFTFESPVTLKIEFHSTAMTDQACLMPDVCRLDGRTIEYTHADYAVLFEAIMALVTLAASASI